MKHLWKQRIRQEFEAPAIVVIQSFASSGYSKRLTAGAIGITTQTLLRYCRENSINFPLQKDMRPECKGANRHKGRVNNPWGRKGKLA